MSDIDTTNWWLVGAQGDDTIVVLAPPLRGLTRAQGCGDFAAVLEAVRAT